MNKPNELDNIYKYTSLESGSKILSGLTLKFTNPRDFNDPFDCNIDGVYFDTASVDSYTANDLKVLHNEFPTLKDNLHLIAPAFESSVKNKIQQCAVTCFSLNAKSELMWAHYGDSHRGICIEFNNSLFEQFHKIKIDVEGT
ncbi:DUF2971 domain-containing protein [Pedobacter duraquae]|uniref:DUF2971 family protein n=1 Tax=Pedobacter duraquae TaxID=425511 RepID=A0A4R6IQL4_9SPHI|nr:DUF2971 domain-containing protein [Pedobacter duraquae]TDO24640.1 Protein of unknown function (DUF2971) [Pedobacter duraquae]